MLVAPTELKLALRALTVSGKGSNKPERMGVDFAFSAFEEDGPVSNARRSRTS